MDTSNFIIKNGIGKHTFLEKTYCKLINNVMVSSETTQERWEVYNLINKELLSIDNGRYFKEFQYRITDGENPNEIILDIFSRVDDSDVSGLAWSLKGRVKEFLEEDFINRFF